MSRIAWGRYNIQNQVLRGLRRAAAEIERQKAIEEKKRREDEKLRRLLDRRNQALNRLGQVQNLKQSLIKDDLLMYIDTRQIDNEITRIKSSLSFTDRLTDITSLVGEIGKLERKIKRDRNEAENKKKQYVLEQDRKRLYKEKIDKEIAEITNNIKTLKDEFNYYISQNYSKLESDKIQDIIFLISDIEQNISSKNSRRLKENFAEIEKSFGVLKGNIEQKIVKWDCEVTSIEELINQAEIELGLLKEDKVIIGWNDKGITGLQNLLIKYTEKCPSIKSAYDFQVLSIFKMELELYLEQCKSVREQAYKMENQEKERAYVINGVMNVLSEMGFNISQGPNLSEATNPASTVVLEAELPAGKNVEVKVNLNGAIYTDFNGYYGDECVGDMANFRNKLLDHYSICYELNGIQGTNPDKIKKGARGIPGGTNYNTNKS